MNSSTQRPASASVSASVSASISRVSVSVSVSDFMTGFKLNSSRSWMFAVTALTVDLPGGRFA
jgi:hypothetical protein